MPSKLGIHAQIPSQELRTFTKELKPGTIKTMFVDHEMYEQNPNALWILRAYHPMGPDQFRAECRRDPVAAAKFHFDHALSYGPPKGWYLETWNEFFGYGSEADFPFVDAYQAEYARRCLDAGYGVVLGNCGTGNVEVHWFNSLAQSLRTWLDGKGRVLWGWHEYDWPSVLSTHRQDERLNGGMWFGLRHRRVLQELWERGVVSSGEAARLWSVVTEFGVTQLRRNPPGGDYGYKYLAAGEIGQTSPSRYHWQETMLAYDREVSQDDRLLGVCHYMVGSERQAAGPEADWRTFDALSDLVLSQLWLEYHHTAGVFNPTTHLRNVYERRPSPNPSAPPPPEPAVDGVRWTVYRSDNTRIGHFNTTEYALKALPVDGYIVHRPTSLRLVMQTSNNILFCNDTHGIPRAELQKYSDDIMGVAIQLISIGDVLGQKADR